MAKKTKLNKELAAFALVGLIVIGAGGTAMYRVFVVGKYRPAQLKDEGREFMLQGDWEEAHARFSRVGQRLATDMEYLNWFYETKTHLTSFDEKWQRDADRHVEVMLSTNPNYVPALELRLTNLVQIAEALLAQTSSIPLEAFPDEIAERTAQQAERVLAKEPTSPIAIRAKAITSAMPILRQTVSVAAADVEKKRDELRTVMEASPEVPELLEYYAYVTVKLRDALLRDAQITNAASNARVAELFEDVMSRAASVVERAGDETKPAAWRGDAYTTAMKVEALMVQSRLVVDMKRISEIVQNRIRYLEEASRVMPTTDDQYVAVRAWLARSYAQARRVDEGEKLLRETVEALPLQWTPRLELAEYLSEQDRPGEAVEVLSAQLKPDYNLIGDRGTMFLRESKIVPLRRAFYRLQNLAKLKPEERPAEIARVQADYQTAVAEGRNPDADPWAMQVRAGLLELNNDRSGAAQLLTRALQVVGENTANQQFRTRLMRQLLNLNLQLNQPGAAITLLEQMMQEEEKRLRTFASQQQQAPLRSQEWLTMAFQLLELKTRAGETSEARTLLAELEKAMPNNPALVGFRLRLTTDDAERARQLASFPEDQANAKAIKFGLALELKEDATVRRLGKEILAENPDNVAIAIRLADYLRRNGNTDEALAILKPLLEKRPDDQGLKLLVKDIESPADDRVGNLKGMMSPYQRALLEADEARLKNDLDTYKAKLLEAQGADVKDGTATERLFFLAAATRDFAGAEAALAKLTSLGRDPSSIRVLRIRLALAMEKLEDATNQADSLVAQLPTFAPGWLMKGQAHHARGQNDRAITAYETVLSLQPDNIEALRGLVECSQRAGRQDALKRYIDEGLRVTKNNDDFFVDWSLRYQVAYGDPIGTIEPRIKRRDAGPDKIENWLALAVSYQAAAEARAKAGDTAGQKDYTQKMIALFKEAIVKFPDAPGFVVEAANQMYRAGDTEGGLKLITDLRANPKFGRDPNLQPVIADFYLQINQAQSAVQVMEEAIANGYATDALRVKLATLFMSNINDPQRADKALPVISQVKETPFIRELKMNIFLESGRTQEATKYVDDGLTAERSTANLLMAGYVYSRTGRAADAIKLANEAVTRDPENAAARFMRARMMISERPIRNNDLIADLEVVRKNAPDNIDARLILVDRLQAVGRSADAMVELESINREAPGNLDAAVRIIREYARERRQGRIEQVLADAKKAGLAMSPQLWSLEADIYTQRNGPGDRERAIDARKKAWEYSQGDIAMYRAFLGSMIKFGEHKLVIDELNRIEGANQNLYWTYLTRGVAQHRLNNEPAAQKEFDRALELANSLNDSEGPVNEVANNYALEYGAEAAVDWVSNRLPKTIEAKVLAMRILVAGGRFDKAIATGESLLPDLDKLPAASRLQILNALGTAYLTVAPARPHKAIEVFTMMDQIEPNNMLTLNNLAYSMTLQGSGATMQQAVEVAKRANDLAIQNSAPNAYIRDTYGWTLVQAQQLDEGLRVLQEALDIERLPETEYHIGYVYLMRGDKAGALQNLQNALANLGRAEQNGRPVDATLRTNIESAINQANAIPN